MDNLFATRLNRAIELKKLTTGMLAIKTGMSAKMIRNYRQGKSQPSAYSARLLARSLGVSVDWLIGMDEEESK